MKKWIIFSVLVAMSQMCNAQQQALRVKNANVSFDSAVAYTLQQMHIMAPYDSSEGGERNQFIRWAEFHKNRIAYDAPVDSNILMPA